MSETIDFKLLYLQKEFMFDKCSKIFVINYDIENKTTMRIESFNRYVEAI